ncbi:hypothetical protein PoB_004034200 [Plakobranchus ocellatus]|uniref:Uncharacterized protein n=1 Tax=Plakobranchus ocellatus TaxID=259542 RepID=A0AAV4B2U8_9GAST|nr:hypothetical protein PoB_004034200 [Plakobranchus ocellatus]
MPDSVKAVTGIAKRLLLIFYKVALGESCVAHPQPTHCRLPFSVCSFTSFAEVFSQVGEYFVELVCSLSIPIFLPNRVDHMYQSIVHHPLEGLTQAARERNRPIVGRIRRILPVFWNWNHRRLPPRWEDVPGGPNIKKFKENM